MQAHVDAPRDAGDVSDVNLMSFTLVPLMCFAVSATVHNPQCKASSAHCSEEAQASTTLLSAPMVGLLDRCG
jgi:hypothetical protein